MKHIPLSIIAFFLVSCYSRTPTKQDIPLEVKEAPVREQRITVERVAVFVDGLAYGGERGVYIIRDNDTKKEYIGVSGIGISETGSHSNGKTQTSDER